MRGLALMGLMFFASIAGCLDGGQDPESALELVDSFDDDFVSIRMWAPISANLEDCGPFVAGQQRGAALWSEQSGNATPREASWYRNEWGCFDISIFLENYSPFPATLMVGNEPLVEGQEWTYVTMTWCGERDGRHLCEDGPDGPDMAPPFGSASFTGRIFVEPEEVGGQLPDIRVASNIMYILHDNGVDRFSGEETLAIEAPCNLIWSERACSGRAWY